MKLVTEENTIDWANKTLLGARDKIIASNKVTLTSIIERIHLLQYAEKNGIPTDDSHLHELINDKTSNQEVRSLLNTQFEVLSHLHTNANALSGAPSFNDIDIPKTLQEIDARLVDESLKIFDISNEVGKAKKILNPSSVSYIVPSREAIVFKAIFDHLKKDFDFTKDGDAYITQWYRHTIALSLKAQQPIVIYTLEKDDAAKKAAAQYLPGSEIREVSSIHFLLEATRKNPEHVGFFNKLISGRGEVTHSELQKTDDITAFTPFPDYSPNTHVNTNVVAVAQLTKEAKIESDTPLSVSMLQSQTQYMQ